ncbi:MAG: hypothetical protein M3401_08675 [Actinomycetota bacterium]|nr:hypothetical protein [Actinomycetota bacterium]
MLRIRLLAALVAGVALLVPVASARAALETLVQDDASLLHRPADQARVSMQKLRSLGVDRVRLTANWSVLTRSPDSEQRPDGFDARDPGAYPQAVWQGLDDAVRLAHEAGLKVMIDIGFWAPRWATTDAPGPRARTNINAARFADYAVAVARRYGGSFAPLPTVVPPPPPSQDQTLLDMLLGGPSGGKPPFVTSLKPLPAVDQFVLWNEPNHPSLLLPQWKGRGKQAKPASPAIYARMVRAAYAAVKPLRPEASFLLGNTSSDGGKAPSGAVAPLLFLRELACVDAKLRPLETKACKQFKRLPGDGWAHHPYARQLRPDNSADESKPDNARVGSLNRLSKLLRRLAARKRIAKALQRIHITEFGYETSPIAGRPTLSQARQARWITWAEYLSSRVPGVVTYAQFLLRDLPPGPVRVSTSKARGFGQYYSGLQTVEGKDKLAATSFTAGLFALRTSERRVLLWGRLRLGAGAKAIGIERKRGDGKWRLVSSLTVDGRQAFKMKTPFVSRALYRLRWPRADGTTGAGLPIRPVTPFKPAATR